MPYTRLNSQPENPFSKLIPGQSIAVVPSFELENGDTLHKVPVAYKTWGKLSPEADNALVVCHALSGSADVADWWGPVLGGPDRALDISRFFVICVNSLGSPYGTASPVTYRDGDPTKGIYGPEFPLTTIRDDVRLARLILDDLGVRQIAAVVGGSMGGMLALEYAYFGKDYVKTIVPIATSAIHNGWCIGWGEGQRQCIFSDLKYDDGYYSFDDPPASGLGAARMQALMTYRTHELIEKRHGRHYQDESKDSHPQGNGSNVDGKARGPPNRAPLYFTMNSYLKYQGQKFVKRFDANCYVAITYKLDTHDVSWHVPYESPKQSDAIETNGTTSAAQQKDENERLIYEALQQIKQPALVLGVQSDALFAFGEQEKIARGIPDSRLENIESIEGHDAFLLQFKQVNDYLLGFWHERLSDIMERKPRDGWESELDGVQEPEAQKKSTVGEAEAEDITAW